MSYWDAHTNEQRIFTHSRVNRHMFMCDDCGRDERECGTKCLELRQRRDLAERFYLGSCYAEHDEGYKAALAWYLGELGEPPTLEQAYYLGKKLLTW